MVRQILPDDSAQILWCVTHDQRTSEYCILGFTAGDPGYIITKMADDAVGFVIDHLFALYSISDR